MHSGYTHVNITFILLFTNNTYYAHAFIRHTIEPAHTITAFTPCICNQTDSHNPNLWNRFCFIVHSCTLHTMVCGTKLNRTQRRKERERKKRIRTEFFSSFPTDERVHHSESGKHLHAHMDGRGSTRSATDFKCFFPQKFKYKNSDSIQCSGVLRNVPENPIFPICIWCVSETR